MSAETSGNRQEPSELFPEVQLGASPDGHESQQSPAGVVDLSRGALDVAPLLTRLKVLPPASVRHLLLQQEPARFLHLHRDVSGHKEDDV